jgi:hypothetical protein
MENEVTVKLQSAAKEIGDALGNFGASMFGGASSNTSQRKGIPEQQ